MYALPTSCNLLLRLNSTILYSLLLTPQLPVPPLACEFNQGMLPHGIYIRAGRGPNRKNTFRGCVLRFDQSVVRFSFHECS